MKQKAGEPRVETGATPAGVDDRLRRLLDVEQELEARVRTAEQAARASLDAARAAAEHTDGAQRQLLEAAALAEERADLERHAAELATIARDGAARVAALRAVSDVEILRLADKALAIVAGIDVRGTVPS